MTESLPNFAQVCPKEEKTKEKKIRKKKNTTEH